MNEVDPKIYKFGPFHIDMEQRLLFRGGVALSLAPKSFDTLAILVARKGKIVEKAELINLVWPETFVEENNLNQNISALRKALGDAEYIETIPRRGYRFVTPSEDSLAVSAPPPDPKSIQSPPIPGIPRWIWGALSIMAIAGLAYFISMRVPNRERVNHPVDSLVVLPFMNLSATPDSDYFSDGLTEEITNVLAHIDGLRVVARTTAFQFKGKAQDVREIARQLHVDAVLEGSVRREQNRLRVTAQLNDAEGGYHIWSQTYDRDEGGVFNIQEDISRQIAHAVRPNGTPLAVPGGRNLEAHNFYLKGRYYWNRRAIESLKTAVGYFQNAIAKDPGYALAWSGLADCYVLFNEMAGGPSKESFPKARTAAQKALALDPTLGEAQATLAYIKFEYDWDWAGADRDFRKALQLNPGYSTAHQWYGQYLAAMGRFDEAVAEVKRAQELDPVSLSIQTNVGRIFRYARRYDEALEQLHVALAMDPNLASPHLYAGLSYMFQSKCSQAIGEYQTGLKVRHPFPPALAYLGYTYTRCGKMAEARETVHELEELSKNSFLPPGLMVPLLAGLGDKDGAFKWLAKTVEERDFDVVWLKIDPLFDLLRSDPRFDAVLRQVNLGQ